MFEIDLKLTKVEFLRTKTAQIQVGAQAIGPAMVI